MTTVSFDLGVLAPHIKDQIPQLTDRQAQHIEKQRQAINILRIHSTLTRAEAKNAEKRLVKYIFETLGA